MFAPSLAGLGVLSLVYGNFAPLVGSVPGPAGVTQTLGVVVLLAAVGLLIPRTFAAAAAVAGLLTMGWAWESVPPILQSPLSIGSWYGISEAVSTLTGLGALYALYRRGLPSVVLAARLLFGAACLVYGFAHFAYNAYTALFVPTWLPGTMPFVYITGALHVAAGLGLVLGVVPSLAARLEAIMIILFGVLVWLPTFFSHPAPKWAGTPHNQWSEVLVNFLLAGVGWLVADALASSSKAAN